MGEGEQAALREGLGHVTLIIIAGATSVGNIWLKSERLTA
ncbi:hypothetical protein ACP70R_026931 [Stipagrostis hirtigluma subsp. patula]